MSNHQNQVWEETALEQIIQDNEGKLQDIHAKNYMGTDDDMPDKFNDWLCDLSLDEVCEMLNITVYRENQSYKDMQTQYE